MNDSIPLVSNPTKPDIKFFSFIAADTDVDTASVDMPDTLFEKLFIVLPIVTINLKFSIPLVSRLTSPFANFVSLFACVTADSTELKFTFSTLLANPASPSPKALIFDPNVERDTLPSNIFFVGMAFCSSVIALPAFTA